MELKKLMNQDTGYSGESNGCGNPFSIYDLKILNHIQVKYEDESVNYDSE